MIKIHCDLCNRVVGENENLTEIIWKDRESATHIQGIYFRCNRKLKAQICDCCIDGLRRSVKEVADAKK